MKPRKKYRPRGVSLNPIYIATQGVRLLSRDDQLLKAEAVALAVAEIKRGQAGKPQWTAVFDCLNMVEELLKNPKVATNDPAYIEAKQEAIVSILDRHKATGSKALRAEEIAALDDLVALWADLLGVVTHHEYFLAQEAVEKRMRRVMSGNVPQGVRVLEAA